MEKTNIPFRYDQNQIPYDYTMEVTNRSKGLDWIVGEVAAVISFQSTLSSKENRAAPRLSAQLFCFLSTSVGQERQSLPEPR